MPRPGGAVGLRGPRRSPRDRSRPAGSTRPAASSLRERPLEERRRADPGSIRRALAMGMLIVLMLIVLTPALRSYLQQRSSISQLKQEKAQLSASVNGLQRQKNQWMQPDYVKQQASQRLNYSMPGKEITIYVDGSNKTHAVTKQTGVTRAPSLAGRPWYGQVWGSIATSNDSNASSNK